MGKEASFWGIGIPLSSSRKRYDVIVFGDSSRVFLLVEEGKQWRVRRRRARLPDRISVRLIPPIGYSFRWLLSGVTYEGLEQAGESPDGREDAHVLAPRRGSVLSNVTAYDAVNATRVFVHDLLLSRVGGTDVVVTDSSLVLRTHHRWRSRGTQVSKTAVVADLVISMERSKCYHQSQNRPATTAGSK